MSSADAEGLVKYMVKLDDHMGKFNKVVAGLTRVIDKNVRAQTKVVAAANKTHGVMLGVVADLELMGGAFGKVKKFLANLLLPINEDTPKILKFGRAISSVSGFMEQVISPMFQAAKAGAATVHAKNAEIAALNKVAKADMARVDSLSKMEARFGLFQKLMGGDQTMVGFPRHQFAGLGGVDESTGMPILPTDTVMGAIPMPVAPPPEFVGRPAPMAGAGEGDEDEEAMDEGAKDMKSGKMKKAMTFWKDNVTTPVKQIASGGIGLGFQTTIIMGLMQAFAGMFTIFQPIIEVVGMLVERLSVGFMPLIEMIMEILTSPPVIALVEMLADVLARVFEMFRPLVPIIIMLIEMAITPLMQILENVMPMIQIIADLFATLLTAFMPIIAILLDALMPVLEVLIKLFLLLVVVGLYPLMAVIWGFGIIIAALMDLFTWYAHDYMGQWNAMMIPIFDAMNLATGMLVAEFHTGTDYVPQTGLYMLERGEAVVSAQDNRGGAGGSGRSITINIDGGIWVQDLDDFVNTIGRKLSLYR